MLHQKSSLCKIRFVQIQIQIQIQVQVQGRGQVQPTSSGIVYWDIDGSS